MIKYSLLCLKNRDHKKLIANAIMHISKLDWNHIEILRYDTETGEMVSYGSIYPVSRKINYEDLLEQYEVKHEIPLFPNVDNSKCDNKLESLMNKPYSQGEIFLMYLSIIFKDTINWLPFVKLNLTDELVCTEVYGEFVIDCCGYKLGKSQEMLTLVDVYNNATSHLP